MNVGDKAPEILGKDEQGRDISLSDYSGRKLVLYFYPKDNTSGCTAKAVLTMRWRMFSCLAKRVFLGGDTKAGH